MLLQRVLVLLLAGSMAAAQATKEPSSIEEATADLERHDGFFTYYWDSKAGKIWLEVSRFDEDFLYVNSLATGLGSNPVGLDRSQLGRDRVVRFERVGPRVLLVQDNLEYRAVTDNPDEQRAVRESFARSVLWGAEVAAESGGRVLLDATDFLLRDAHDVIGRLKQSGQGSFSLDRSRSAPYLPRTRAFPDNTEFEVTLTFASNDPGRLVSEVTPSAESVTLRQRHSFVRLPEAGYQPRRFDPRSGAIPVRYFDYAQPLDQPLEQRLVMRHRLRKQDPSAELSEAVEPIVYYLDRGTPEPVRGALLDGARWWNAAFEAAGYRDAFRVELLPEGADPLDVRYNVIQWVHRSTRGWSYGSSVVDPRTGEILKGHVQLGSLRVRQDRMIVESLHPLFNGSDRYGSCALEAGVEAAALAAFDPEAEPVEVALARIRQLSAHEVGHTLGFAHNFAASSYGRASVMDYPAPLARVREGGDLDLSEAYGVGVGDWDRLSVRYSYTDFPAGQDETEELTALLDEAIGRGWYFLSDADARPASAAQPIASLWDNGEDPVAMLRQVMAVRRVALDNFGEGNLPPGRPLSELQNVFVPLYLYHRYQVEAAAKVLGGVFYHYKVRGDALPEPEPVPAARQREALEALLETLQPSELTVPRRLALLLHPLAYGSFDRRELFASRVGPTFDPLAAAETAADTTLTFLLNAGRAGRCQQWHDYDSALPGFQEVLDRLLEATWMAPAPADTVEAATARVVQKVVLARLVELAGNDGASGDVRALASERLAGLADWLQEEEWEGVQAAHAAEAVREISAFLGRPHPSAEPPEALDAPPGSPIGQ